MPIWTLKWAVPWCNIYIAFRELLLIHWLRRRSLHYRCIEYTCTCRQLRRSPAGHHNWDHRESEPRSTSGKVLLLDLAYPCTGGSSDSILNSLVSLLWKVSWLLVVVSLLGRVFQSVGATTENKSSYRLWNNILLPDRRLGTIACMTERDSGLNLILMFGILSFRIFHIVSRIYRSLLRCRDRRPRSFSLSQ